MYNKPYRQDVKKYTHYEMLIVLLCFMMALLAILSLLFIIAFVPVGLAMLGGSIWLFCVLLKKVRKKMRIVKDRMKEYEQTHKMYSPPIKGEIQGDTTYCFTSPMPIGETMAAIKNAFEQMGEILNVVELRGLLKGKVYISATASVKVEFYAKEDKGECKCRAVFRKKSHDDCWDEFLSILYAQNPGKDFSVTPAEGHPYLMGASFLEGETRQVYTARTSGGTSLSGFLIGGALFGEAGAIVGGLSGTQRTKGYTSTEIITRRLVRVIYNNGRMWEGTVKKGSPMWHEIVLLTE